MLPTFCCRKLWECWPLPRPVALFILLPDLITTNSQSVDFWGGRWTTICLDAQAPDMHTISSSQKTAHTRKWTSFSQDGEREGVRKMPQYTILFFKETSACPTSILLYPYVYWVMGCQASFGTSFVVLYLSLQCENNCCPQIL